MPITYYNRYSTLTNSDIVKIPIENLSNDGCIFVVWVTNKQAHIDFVKEELFPLWKVKFRAIWHWLKVNILFNVRKSRNRIPPRHPPYFKALFVITGDSIW